MRNRSGIGHGALHCTGVELKAEETQVAAPQKVAQSADRKAVRLNMEARAFSPLAGQGVCSAAKAGTLSNATTKASILMASPKSVVS
jgi:hypothetical protein